VHGKCKNDFLLGEHVSIKYSQTPTSSDNAIVLEQSEELSDNKSEYTVCPYNNRIISIEGTFWGDTLYI
jgi:hypothetical protein